MNAADPLHRDVRDRTFDVELVCGGLRLLLRQSSVIPETEFRERLANYAADLGNLACALGDLADPRPPGPEAATPAAGDPAFNLETEVPA